MNIVWCFSVLLYLLRDTHGMGGEVSAKTTYQRISTGPIIISEVSPEGKSIVLENVSSGPNRMDVNMDGWKLRRIVDGKRDYTYNFRNFKLKAGKKDFGSWIGIRG